MEFLPYGSLADLLRNKSSPSLRLVDTQTIMNQCLLALRYLHASKISHSSIRLESILIRTYDPLHICFCIFESSKEGADDVAFAADMYGLGVILSILLDHTNTELHSASPLQSTGQLASGAPWALLSKRLRSYEPRLRPTLEECLSNPWLQKGNSCKRDGPIEDAQAERPSKRRHESDVDLGEQEQLGGAGQWTCVIA